ncbi:MAG: hypothetical protein KBA31_09315 [Alphaproteobacteria bacterium]|nr:hypothetical protein [Alphaproteobacteria bacterium]
MTTDAAAKESTGPRVPRLARLRSVLAPLLDDRLDLHVIAAFIMVAISIFGAVAAFRVALAEHRSVALERRLALGQLQDISYRQQLLAEVLVGIGMKNVERTLKNEAVDLRQAYKAFRSAHDPSSNWLEWHAAELMAQRNASRRFSTYMRDLVSKDLSVEQEVATGSAAELRRLGILATVEKERNVEPALKFEQLDKAIAAAHEVGPQLAFIVLLFVLGLVCLTLAELNLGPPRLWWILTASGTLIAIGAAVAMLIIDPQSIWAMLPLTVLLVVAAVLAARNGLFLRERAPGHAPHPEAPEPGRVSFAHLTGHTTHDTWSRRIVLLITVSVFVSAAFAWLYSVSLKHTGEFALEAQKERAELVNRRTRLGAVTMGGAFDSSIDFLSKRVRCATATQLHALAADGMVDFSPAQLDAERKRRCDSLKQTTDNNPQMVETLDDHDLADSASSPAKRMSDNILDRKGGPATLFARSDGFAEISAGWGKRAARLLAVLTVLAIALYLFGQAYTMGETTAGRWLIGSGVVLLTASVAFGGYAWLSPVAASPDALPEGCLEAKDDHHHTLDDPHHIVEFAAIKYAEGVAEQNLASTSEADSSARSRADHAAAIAYACAIAARPGFIPAYKNYQRVISRMDNPQRNEDYSSLNSRTKLSTLREAQLNELRSFVNAGMLRPRNLLANFAFDSTVLALADAKPDALSEAHLTASQITGNATWWQRLYIQTFRPELWSDEEPSTDAVDWLNLGLLQLASGDQDELDQAEATYAKALRNGEGISPALRASALTDIEILKSYCTNLHKEIRVCSDINAAIERIRPTIAAGRPADALAARDVGVTDFVASISPHAVTWQARFDGLDPKRDRLTIAWFRDDSPAPGAAVDPNAWELRRALADQFQTFAKPEDFPAPDNTGLTKQSDVFVDDTGACLTPGRYVAELFLNGTLRTSQVATIEGSELRAYKSRDLDLTWCIPTAWQPWSGKTTGHPWFEDRPMRGFVINAGSDTPKLGGVIMTFYAPATLSEDKRRAYFLRRAIRILLRKDQRDDKGNASSSWSQEAEDRLARNVNRFEDFTERDCRANTPLGSMTYRFLTNRSDKNMVHIAIVDGRLPAKDACTILGSVTNYF